MERRRSCRALVVCTKSSSLFRQQLFGAPQPLLACEATNVFFIFFCSRRLLIWLICRCVAGGGPSAEVHNYHVDPFRDVIKTKLRFDLRTAEGKEHEHKHTHEGGPDDRMMAGTSV